MPLDEQQILGFYSALGEEFCYQFSAIVGDELVPMDGEEVFFRVFGSDFQPEMLRDITDAQMERLQDVTRNYLEYPIVGENQLQEVIDRTLWRWPPESKM